jgi:hypothetical protein
MPEWRAYHGASSSQHQTRFNELSAAGVRILSLSVYGPPASPRYAAVWVHRPGPSYVAFHDRSPAQYQQLVTEQLTRGRPRRAATSVA